MADKTANIKLPDARSLDFPVLSGTLGPDVIDIRTLYGKSGMFTYDPGYLSTASCSSAITFIDGDQGILLYRGYPIEQLAQHCDFLEVCYTLLNGDLPDRKQKDEFVNIVTHHTMVHEQLARLYQGFRRDAHPMAVMVGVVGALSAFYHDALDINNPQHRIISAFRLIAKMPTIVGMSYKYSIGQPFVYPRNDLSYTANFMRMMFAVPAEEYKPNDVLVRAMDRIFILHADHEQNASTSTVRLCFGMARDEKLPGSSALRIVSPKLHTPWVACIVVTLLAATKVQLGLRSGRTSSALGHEPTRRLAAVMAKVLPTRLLVLFWLSFF